MWPDWHRSRNRRYPGPELGMQSDPPELPRRSLLSGFVRPSLHPHLAIIIYHTDRTFRMCPGLVQRQCARSLRSNLLHQAISNLARLFTIRSGQQGQLPKQQCRPQCVGLSDRPIPWFKLLICSSGLHDYGRRGRSWLSVL